MKEFVLSIVITWALVNLLKPVLTWIREKKITAKALAANGGMPSGHTSAVASLSTALFLETGFSTEFVIGLVFCFIVIYDALQVRTIIEKQSRIINQLMAGKENYEKLDEQVGHKFSEVLVSIIFGILIPVTIYTIM